MARPNHVKVDNKSLFEGAESSYSEKGEIKTTASERGSDSPKVIPPVPSSPPFNVKTKEAVSNNENESLEDQLKQPAKQKGKSTEDHITTTTVKNAESIENPNLDSVMNQAVKRDEHFSEKKLERVDENLEKSKTNLTDRNTKFEGVQEQPDSKATKKSTVKTGREKFEELSKRAKENPQLASKDEIPKKQLFDSLSEAVKGGLKDVSDVKDIKDLKDKNEYLKEARDRIQDKTSETGKSAAGR